MRTPAVMIGSMLAAATIAWGAEPTLPTKPVLTLDAALHVAAAARDEAVKRHATVVIAVVDDGGHLIVLHLLGATQVASVQGGIGKPRTVAIFRRPRLDFARHIRNGRIPALLRPLATPLHWSIPL